MASRPTLDEDVSDEGYLPEDDLPEGQVVRRVALDIGSGVTKCIVADVVAEANLVAAAAAAGAARVHESIVRDSLPSFFLLGLFF